jgi:hypothetical protein
MLTAGCMKLDAAGRVIITVDGVPVAFNGGTPITASGAMAAASANPEVFLASLPYVNNGAICARAVVPAGSGWSGGFARDSAGGLAFATAEPIAGYIAGIPVTADGRIAVSLEGPPPVNTSGFDNGFDQTAFH